MKSNGIEWNPECFVPVEMIYIEYELYKHPLKAFVDTGALKSIIGPNRKNRMILFVDFGIGKAEKISNDFGFHRKVFTHSRR